MTSTPPSSAFRRARRHLLLPTALLLSLNGALFPLRAADPTPAPASPPAYRFKVETLASGMPQPMELEVTADGHIFWNELGGSLKCRRPDGSIISVAQLDVFAEQESGFLGFALDPNHASNHWIYLFHSPKNYNGGRLSRFTLDPNTQIIPSSERIILEFPEQRRDCCHHAGSVEFAPDGCILISTGDNTHPGGDSDGYAPIDERPDREPYDAQKSASNTHDLRGKILRIRPTPEGSYTIPEGNLFPKDGSRGRPEIYVMGCRNPWRMSVDQATGIVYWGEVGPDAGGDNKRGSRGYDEINQAKKAGNFGWPYFVGNNFPYAHFDMATRTLGALYDPARPVNRSPNNSGSEILPPAQPAFIYWPYGASKEFPELGQGGRTACAGPVFHFNPSFKNTGGFPEVFDRSLLFWDWQRPFLRWARLDSNNNLIRTEPFPSIITLANSKDQILSAEQRGEVVIRRPIDAQFGIDGCLYMLDYGETWGVNPDSRLIKISYQWGNLAPIAKATAEPSAGRAPLNVQLSSTNSFDHDHETLSYQWRLLASSPTGSTTPTDWKSSEANPTLQVREPGNYLVELTVTDPHQAHQSTSLPLIVGNEPPQVTFTAPRSGDFFTPDQPLAFQVSVRDAEDGSSEEDEGLMAARTFVRVNWNPGQPGSQAGHPGLALMTQSDCFNCHAIDSKIVGPAFLDVAKKYRGQPGALDASVQRVIKGSSKVWGEVPMLPHASFTTDQVQLMVQWVFALEPGKTDALFTKGLTGKFQTLAKGLGSTVNLEATYADAGKPPANPLTTKTTVQLRQRRLEAEKADQIQGPKVLGSSKGSGRSMLGAIDDQHSIHWTNLNLSTSSSVTARVASAGAGGSLEFRSGSPSGNLIASIEVKPTGDWENWVELSAPLPPALSSSSTPQDVWIVFRNPGKGGLMNLDWVQFNASVSTASSAKAAIQP